MYLGLKTGKPLEIIVEVFDNANGMKSKAISYYFSVKC